MVPFKRFSNNFLRPCQVGRKENNFCIPISSSFILDPCRESQSNQNDNKEYIVHTRKVYVSNGCGDLNHYGTTLIFEIMSHLCEISGSCTHWKKTEQSVEYYRVHGANKDFDVFLNRSGDPNNNGILINNTC